MSWDTIYPNERARCGPSDVQFSVHKGRRKLRARLVIGRSVLAAMCIGVDDEVCVEVGAGRDIGYLRIFFGGGFKLSADKRKGYGVLHLPAEALGIYDTVKPCLVDHTYLSKGLQVCYDPTMEVQI